MYYFLVSLYRNLGSYYIVLSIIFFSVNFFLDHYVFFQSMGFKAFMKKYLNTSHLNKNIEFTGKNKTSKENKKNTGRFVVLDTLDTQMYYRINIMYGTTPGISQWNRTEIPETLE